MKKVKNRALSVLLLVAFIIAGMGFYIVRYTIYGGQWASAAFNRTVYDRGVLSAGTLTDRNGVVLADAGDGTRIFAESADTRRATLHVTGDAAGNIGTGALTAFARELMGYNIITGAYSRTGAGKMVAHTIDSRLNVEAYRAMDGRRGAVMVMNYETGEILCMYSGPAYDPADPPVIIEEDPAYEGVFINRAISASYTPGSTFKLLTAAAAIENINDISERVFQCDGALETARGTVTCPGAHGSLTFAEALTVSCNIVFGGITLELGADTLARYAEMYGLSERVSVGGIMTAKGNFDKGEPNTADLAWSGIGQYNNSVCPAAMLRFAGAIANGGRAVDMSLIKRTGVSMITPAPQRGIMNGKTADELGSMMNAGFPQSESGSFPNLIMHAKSGTAQVGGDRAPHAWFTGYITNEGYPLAFVVVVENAGGGAAVAGPIANRVLQAAVSN